VSEAIPPQSRPSSARRIRLSLDAWAVLLAAVLTLLVALRAIRSVPW
jgi:hypothetical protein